MKETYQVDYDDEKTTEETILNIAWVAIQGALIDGREAGTPVSYQQLIAAGNQHNVHHVFTSALIFDAQRAGALSVSYDYSNVELQLP